MYVFDPDFLKDPTKLAHPIVCLIQSVFLFDVNELDPLRTPIIPMFQMQLTCVLQSSTSPTALPPAPRLSFGPSCDKFYASCVQRLLLGFVEAWPPVSANLLFLTTVTNEEPKRRRAKSKDLTKE